MQGKYKIDFIFNNSINPGTMTKFLKSSELHSKWFEIDAKDAVVGRLASISNQLLFNSPLLRNFVIMPGLILLLDIMSILYFPCNIILK